MDSTSVGEKAQKEGTLQSASTHRPSSISHRHGASARVVLTDHSSDDETEMDEDEEEAAPMSKPMRPNSNHATREKPLFSNSGTHPSVSFDLCDFRGDRVPYTINRYLRDYQREGIRFMYNNYTNSRGCILGDDMGLGKTVQVIGFLAAVLHKTGTWEDIENNKPQFLHSQIPSMQRKHGKVFLIVAPLSVLYNWKEELDTWGYFQCVVVHGLRKDEELARIKKGRIEIALTTYETLRLCLDNFNTIDWSAVVVDEAHKIKNPNSQITQAMKSLKCQIRIGLTGTILQNNLEELWCVMDWAIPGCLGTLAHFRNTYSNPVEQGQRHSATKRALATGRKMVRALARKISHWFLRRTKALIQQQMPKKDDRVVYCSLTDFQKTVYQTVLDSEDVTLLLKSSEKCGCLSGRARRSCCYTTNSQGVRVKYMYFSYMTILRKVASHVALLQSTAATSKKQEKYASAICQKVFQKFPDFVQRCKDEAFEALSDPMYSGKMKVLQKLLRYYLQRRDKVLLFSLSTKLLDVLESYCMAEGLDYSRLDGTTKSKDRVQIVKEFNKSNHINICLVSTMAGGLGLNFVGANVVILFDPTWNPANDLQAIDRAYRIGQCRDVTVLRLISLGTVEEVIYLRQVYKQQLQSSVVGNESARRYFEAVQGHGVHKGELFGIKNLFRLQTEGTCLTRMILEREGQVEAGVMTTTTHMGEEREEEANGVSEHRDPEEQRDLSTIPKSVLDFSSGSEEDDGQQQGVGKKASDSVASPGRTSLLQQGFSKLLQRVKARPDLLEEDSSSGVEESTSARDDKDQEFMKKGSTSSGINKNLSAELIAPGFLKSAPRGAKDGDDLRKERVSFSVRKELEESDGTTSPDNYKPNQLKAKAPKSRYFKVYSDESDDLNVEAVTCPPTSDFNLQNRERGLGKNKKRQRVSAREKARSKYTEEIETFTSSEDEHTPVKTARSGNRHYLTPRKDRSTTELLNKRKAGESKTVSFSNRDGLTSPACKGKERTIDNVLGAVQEVAYTHSNQRVVGGSKAEEKISRAAVRDVFERKMYSQLPANHLLTQEESLSSSPPDSPPRPPAAIRPERPTADHPVTFYKKSTHNTRQTTFIIGGTPEAMRRQQLEEMASKFKFTSLDQFALEILKTTSTQRVEWLRQYYHSLNHPELANIVTGNFPQPNAAQMPSSSSAVSTPSTKVAPHTETRDPQRDVPKLRRHKYCKKNEAQMKPGTLQNYVSPSLKKQESPLNHVPETQKKQTNPQKNVLAPPSDVPSPESEKQEETDCSARRHKRTKRGSVSSSGAVRAGGGLGVDQASSSGLGPQEAAAFLIRTDAPSSPDLSHCWSTTLSKPAAEGVEREQTPSARTKEALRGRKEQSSALSPSEPSTSSRSSLLTDLLGDTSILDDLFKPKSRGTQQNSSPKTTPPVSFTAAHVPPSPGAAEKTHSGPTDTWPSHRSNTQDARRTASKGTRKDFWDILNEGNEESINRLTDLAEVQRVCVKANFVAKSRPVEEEEKKSLWKTNEKFLWKK